jgi:hypothetical protein
VPFDDTKFYALANRGDVASVAINLSLALSNIAFALEAIRDGKEEDLAKRIADIRSVANDVDELFARLTGYTPK